MGAQQSSRTMRIPQTEPAVDAEELRHDWREATAEWLEARSHLTRLQTETCTDMRALMEAAERFDFAAHRRATLTRDAAALAEVLDAYSMLRATRCSQR